MFLLVTYDLGEGADYEAFNGAMLRAGWTKIPHVTTAMGRAVEDGLSDQQLMFVISGAIRGAAAAAGYHDVVDYTVMVGVDAPTRGVLRVTAAD